MALNKPEFHLFKNARYALNGLVEIIRHEKSFRLQILFFLLFSLLAWSLPIPFVHQAILFVSLFIPILSEIINSAIERSVDLVTLEHHELAKRAKDAGAALVFVSFAVVAVVWVLTLYDAFSL